MHNLLTCLYCSFSYYLLYSHDLYTVISSCSGNVRRSYILVITGLKGYLQCTCNSYHGQYLLVSSRLKSTLLLTNYINKWYIYMIKIMYLRKMCHLVYWSFKNQLKWTIHLRPFQLQVTLLGWFQLMNPYIIVRYKSNSMVHLVRFSTNLGEPPNVLLITNIRWLNILKCTYCLFSTLHWPFQSFLSTILLGVLVISLIGWIERKSLSASSILSPMKYSLSFLSWENQLCNNCSTTPSRIQWM